MLRHLIENLNEIIAIPEAPPADPLAVQLGLEDLDTSALDLDILHGRDPILDRLFPPGYTDDAEALEFRRFTELGLRQQKLANVDLVLGMLDDGDKITLDATQAQAWLVTLNDVRLAISVRLDIETPERHQELSALPEDDPRTGLYHLYEFLTYLQDSLLTALG